MVNGVRVEVREGMPQVGPISPLLASMKLEDLVKGEERRGRGFVRYAEVCIIRVSRRRAGERVLAGIGRYLERRLSVEVNVRSSGVDRRSSGKFLSISFHWRQGEALIRVVDGAIGRGLKRLRELTRRGQSGLVVEVIRAINGHTMGWRGCFGLFETGWIFPETDRGLRRRLRQMLRKRWKRGRTRYR